ncbi:MAG: hypothetical protein ACFFAL_10390, partial [Promethearchaeota archaeon]
RNNLNNFCDTYGNYILEDSKFAWTDCYLHFRSSVTNILAPEELTKMDKRLFENYALAREEDLTLSLGGNIALSGPMTEASITGLVYLTNSRFIGVGETSSSYVSRGDGGGSLTGFGLLFGGLVGGAIGLAVDATSSKRGVTVGKGKKLESKRDITRVVGKPILTPMGYQFPFTNTAQIKKGKKEFRYTAKIRYKQFPETFTVTITPLQWPYEEKKEFKTRRAENLNRISDVFTQKQSIYDDIADLIIESK